MVRRSWGYWFQERVNGVATPWEHRHFCVWQKCLTSAGWQKSGPVMTSADFWPRYKVTTQTSCPIFYYQPLFLLAHLSRIMHSHHSQSVWPCHLLPLSPPQFRVVLWTCWKCAPQDPATNSLSHSLCPPLRGPQGRHPDFSFPAIFNMSHSNMETSGSFLSHTVHGKSHTRSQQTMALGPNRACRFY